MSAESVAWQKFKAVHGEKEKDLLDLQEHAFKSGIRAALKFDEPDHKDLPELTDRQKEIMSMIRGYAKANGYPPTVREMCKAMRIQSPSGIMCHLRALERKGYIVRGESSARAIKFV